MKIQFISKLGRVKMVGNIIWSFGFMLFGEEKHIMYICHITLPAFRKVVKEVGIIQKLETELEMLRQAALKCREI